MLLLEEVFNRVLLLDQVLGAPPLPSLPLSATLSPTISTAHVHCQMLNIKLTGTCPGGGGGGGKSCYLFIQGHLFLILSGQLEPHYSLIWLFSPFSLSSILSLWKLEIGGLTFL